MYSLIKRFFDVIFAILLILFLFPFFVVSFLLLALSLKQLPIFIQSRPGFKGKVFSIYKLKTMTDKCDESGALMPDNVRLTNVGKVVRRLSLDELPQLLNVLKGEMSFVGPRPLLVEYLKLYTDEQKKRHNVKPGITGWAQVNGRNLISWHERFRLDVWYVQNRNFALDVKILFLTILKVVKADGVSSKGSLTMERFTGNHEA